MSRSYIGRCPGCQSIVAAVVAEWPADWGTEPKGHRTEVAKDVAGFIKDGLLIEQVDSEVVRTQVWGCKCPKAQANKSLQSDTGEQRQLDNPFPQC